MKRPFIARYKPMIAKPRPLSPVNTYRYSTPRGHLQLVIDTARHRARRYPRGLKRYAAKAIVEARERHSGMPRATGRYLNDSAWRGY